jgi:hypothetical protein
MACSTAAFTRPVIGRKVGLNRRRISCGWPNRVDNKGSTLERHALLLHGFDICIKLTPGHFSGVEERWRSTRGRFERNQNVEVLCSAVGRLRDGRLQIHVKGRSTVSPSDDVA